MVEKLFEMSVRSVCEQTDPNFHVVVVCNEVPHIYFEDPRITYHVVDFPPPSSERRATININSIYRDKGTKLMSGLLYSRRFDPDYIAIFDADDLVSRRIAEYIRTKPRCSGWYVDAGYAVNFATNRIQRKYNLHLYCGTSLVPSMRDLLEFSKADHRLDEHSLQDELIRKIPNDFLYYVMGDHKCVLGYFADRGRRLRPLPFRATAWVQENGENNTITRGTTSGIPFTKEFCEEFGLRLDSSVRSIPSWREVLCERLACYRSRASFLRTMLHGLPRAPAVID